MNRKGRGARSTSVSLLAPGVLALSASELRLLLASEDRADRSRGTSRHVACLPDRGAGTDSALARERHFLLHDCAFTDLGAMVRPDGLVEARSSSDRHMRVQLRALADGGALSHAHPGIQPAAVPD